MQYLRSIAIGGVINKDLSLVLIGDGEAGKTSIISALKSDKNQAKYIRSDRRTVGIDVRRWKPDGSEINFKVFDLAGQEIYRRTHQFFLMRLAIYMFVWRAARIKSAEIVRGVKYWLESVQNRVPGSYVLICVTHIDEVNSDVLDEQCDAVKHTVMDFLSNPTHRMFKVWGDGESIRVNCLSGEGIAKLRTNLLDFAASSPWFNERLPRSWVNLRAKIDDLKSSAFVRRYLLWSEMLALTAELDLEKSEMYSALRYFHDIGFIRFFGRGIPTDGESGIQKASLESAIYISPEWMMDLFKGLFRHERQTLLEYFLKRGDKEKVHMLNKLNAGRVDQQLLPFLWPKSPESEMFWNSVWTHGGRECDIWRPNESVISCQNDKEFAIVLLEGFDLLVKHGDELLAPALLPSAQLPCSPKYDIKSFTNSEVLTLSSIPAGLFETIVVRMMKEFKCKCSFTAVFADFLEAVERIKEGKGENEWHRSELFYFKDSKMISKIVWRSTSEQVFTAGHKIISSALSFFSGLTVLWEDNSTNGTKEFRAEQGKDTIVDTTFWFYNEIQCTNCIATGQQQPYTFVLSEMVEKAKEENKRIGKFFTHEAEAEAGDNRRIVNFLPYETEVGEPYDEDARKKKTGEMREMAKCGYCLGEFTYSDVISMRRNLESIRINESRTCPCCKSTCFNCSECRLHLSKDILARGGETVPCYTCLEAVHSGHVNIENIAPPEVYVHGLKLLNGHSIGKFIECLQKIEIEAGVCIASDGCSDKKWSSRIKQNIFVMILISQELVLSKSETKLTEVIKDLGRNAEPHNVHSAILFLESENNAWTSEVFGYKLHHTIFRGLHEYIQFTFEDGVLKDVVEKQVDSCNVNTYLHGTMIFCQLCLSLSVQMHGSEHISSQRLMKILGHIFQCQSHRNLSDAESWDLILRLKSDKWIDAFQRQIQKDKTEIRGNEVRTLRHSHLFYLLQNGFENASSCEDNLMSEVTKFVREITSDKLPKFINFVWSDSPQPLDSLLLPDNCQTVAVSISSMVLNRLRRPGRLNVFSDFSMLGIRLSYLDIFIDKCGGSRGLDGLTTDDVMHRFVKPETRESKGSFCELLTMQGLVEYVGTAEWFYSHAWKFSFLDVVEAAKLFFKERVEGDPIIWFDIFSVSQHKTETRPFEWWNTVFFNLVASIGQVLMVIQPFEHNPTNTGAWTPLNRAWCIFELLACESTLGRFELTMTSKMKQKFLDSVQVQDGLSAFVPSLSLIDCAQSEAGVAEDRDKIFLVINSTVGFPLLNSMVMYVVEKWLNSAMLDQMKSKTEISAQTVQVMKQICQYFYNHRLNTLGSLHPDTLRSERTLEYLSRCEEDLENVLKILAEGYDFMAQQLVELNV